VGPQISSIPGILGGTISADGQVMIILDMGPIIRRGLERAEQPQEVEVAPKEVTRQPLVMVVDDSITMRKVTSRVLDNHSIEVMTAQDGIDAIEQLHSRVPDLMLLDIEMPRMDGYELLEHVRADARLRHVPIVMITSRAGQKHRRKARQAGANDYLTKPYQEVELVEKVGEMLDMELTLRRSD
jgi:chemosensory pili system protein ChpA (sensor histidine kinase/response regulator)